MIISLDEKHQLNKDMALPDLPSVNTKELELSTETPQRLHKIIKSYSEAFNGVGKLKNHETPH